GGVTAAAAGLGRALPMMMTAAGTVPATRVFIMGAGVAGLQAIATARRLGAIVTATDVRPAAKEQVESLGAKFIAIEDEEFKAAETAGGYAKEMSKEYQVKQAALVAEHIKKQDIVITTALIPGRPAPRLISKDMVASMRAGSVVVDLAVERGGNVEGVSPDAVTEINGVKIVGYRNVPGRLAATASSLYAKNVFAFLELLVDKKSKALALNWDDEIIKATALTRDGAVVHPSFRPKSAALSKERHLVMITLSVLGQLDLIAAATGNAPVAASDVPDPFVFRLSIFVLAVFIGYYVVWSVTPALHTPLMSVTNAIS